MAKVVYNACHGGFSVSEAGMHRYCEIKGIPLWVEKHPKFVSLGMATYWIVPPHQRVQPLDGEDFYNTPMEEWRANSAAYDAQTISNRDIERHDPALVQAVEELGDAASGKFAKLRVVEVPDGGKYRIDEYDGLESVVEPDDYEWIIAA